MAVIGYTKDEAAELLEMYVTDLQFINTNLAARMLGIFDKLGIHTMGDLLKTKLYVLRAAEGFGQGMEAALFAALEKKSIYRDGEEPK